MAPPELALSPPVSYGNGHPVRAKGIRLRHVDLLHVFVASPSDVAKERAYVASVVEDANRILPKNHPVQFRVLGYERDVYSDVGEDAQVVINMQINNDYEVLLGIMWTRFGTPTKRALSGTEEEFDRALARRKRNGNLPIISFYFRSVLPSDRGIDTKQLEQVRIFQKKLQNNGVLYKLFPKTEAFRYILLLNLVLIAHAYARSRHTTDELRNEEPRGYNAFSSTHGHIAGSAQISIDGIKKVDPDDFCLYITHYKETLDVLIAYCQDTGEALVTASSAIEEQRQKLQELIKSGRIDKPTTGRVFNKIGDHCTSLAIKLKDSLPGFVNNNRKAVDLLFQIVRVIPDLRPLSETAKIGLAQQTQQIIDNLEACRASIINYKNTIIKFPQNTPHYNRSRKFLGQILEETGGQFLIAIYLFKAFKESLA